MHLMKKSVISLLLIALMLFNLNGAVFASDGGYHQISPLWVNIHTITGGIVKDAGEFSALIKGLPNVTKITATAVLYYKNSNNNWIKTSTSWNYSVNSSSLVITETFTPAPNTDYKVIVEANVYANGYTETVSKEFT